MTPESTTAFTERHTTNRCTEMAGSYCKYCDHRCFVYRQVIVAGETLWSGHMATCPEGKAHDRRVLGCDSSTAHNPYADRT